jgi:adenylate kinase family enzyme
MEGKPTSIPNSKDQADISFVFIVGPPGSNHAAQAEKIALHFGHSYFSVDDMIQDEINAVEKLP